jgi:hypothetical protein
MLGRGLELKAGRMKNARLPDKGIVAAATQAAAGVGVQAVAGSYGVSENASYTRRMSKQRMRLLLTPPSRFAPVPG